MENLNWTFTEENIPYFYNDFLIQCGATKFLLSSAMESKYEEWKLPEYVWKRTKFVSINEIKKFEPEIFGYYKDVDKFNIGYNEEKYQHKINPILSMINQIAICNKYDCSTVGLFNSCHINDLKEVVNRIYKKEVSTPLINILASLKYDKIPTVKLTSNIDKLSINEIFCNSDFLSYSNHHANLHDKSFSLPDISEKIKRTSNLLVDKFPTLHKNYTDINILEKTEDIVPFEFSNNNITKFLTYTFSEIISSPADNKKRFTNYVEPPESVRRAPIPAPPPAPLWRQ